jgi:glutamate N-acetyltransferase / amino-acid N-acetyltransferase
MSVTHPAGFRAAGVAAGLKPSGRPDLGLLVGDPGTTAAGLFTTNRFAAAPVIIGRERIEGAAPRAVLVNSGQANAATGERGDADAIAATASAAAALGMGADEVLPCSTGVIGEPIHMEALLAALPALAAAIGPGGGEDFARAIMTTDTVEKQAVADDGSHRVGGCVKGVGMIAPHLATMLAFVTTDARVGAADLSRLARDELGPRFEALTIDACTSTNDTVLLFASGAGGGAPVEPGTPAWTALAGGVAKVADSLIRQLAEDAEGGTHVVIVDVTGAANETDARLVAKAVADSPLVKTASFGADPNVGRVLQAIGSSGASVTPDLVGVSIGDVEIVRAGTIPPSFFSPGDGLHAAARSAMEQPEIRIGVALGVGAAASRAFGCDLSYDYVKINGEYTT